MADASVKDGEKRESGLRDRISDLGLLVLVLVVGSSLALAMLAVPRPVEPLETPGLVLASAAVDEALARTRALADRAPDDALADAVVEAYLEHGRAEAGQTDDAESHAARRAASVRAIAALRARHGDEAVAALRARAACDLDAALERAAEGGERSDEDVALLGDFVGMMERYGLVVDGAQVAPDAVVRTLFHARWNAAFDLPLTDGLGAVEREAYWGWLALEANEAPLELRLEALDSYEDARGEPAPEARGTLLYLAGRTLAASEQFERARDANGSVRLRNHALAALAAAAAGDLDTEGSAP